MKQTVKLYRNEKERKIGLAFFSTVLGVYVMAHIIFATYFYFF